MNQAVWAFIAALIIAGASADYSAGTKLKKNDCQLSLENCTAKHDKKDMTEKELSDYYSCVDKVTCKRHHRGHMDRLMLLSDVRDRLIAENPDSLSWWNNSACKLNSALVTSAACILTTFMTFKLIVK
ncbi:hypothetical protein BsWGS_06055 [Bradybaena similaris]